MLSKTEAQARTRAVADEAMAALRKIDYAQEVEREIDRAIQRASDAGSGDATVLIPIAGDENSADALAQLAFIDVVVGRYRANGYYISTDESLGGDCRIFVQWVVTDGKESVYAA